MKKIGLALVCVLWTLAVTAQPRPFEIDPSFVPSLEYMQKSWSGEYDGLEPNSGMILSLSRTLVLNSDLTYTNEVKGQIKGQSDEVLLRYDIGTYQYSAENRTVTYSIDEDSTLDVNILLRGEELVYAVNHYKEDGTEMTSTELAQFTAAATDDARQWVLFDGQLMSPIDPRQKAVYVMSGVEVLPSGIATHLYGVRGQRHSLYNLKGQRVQQPQRGLYVRSRQKYIYK